MNILKFKKVKQAAQERSKLRLADKNAPFTYIEAYKALRTNLNFISVNYEYKKIIVTSSIPGEGKSNVSVNLASTLAQSGNSVLVIDCDLRKPVLHKFFGIEKRNKGLTTVLSGAISLDQAIINIKNVGIDIMFSGAIPPNPSELLGSNKMLELIMFLEKQYDYIIFDTPPVAVVTDAAILSAYADGVIMVVRQDFASKQVAQLAVKNLKMVNANIIGTVLNNFDAKGINKDNGYSYSYEYNYSTSSGARY